MERSVILACSPRRGNSWNLLTSDLMGLERKPLSQPLLLKTKQTRDDTNLNCKSIKNLN